MHLEGPTRPVPLTLKDSQPAKKSAKKCGHCGCGELLRAFESSSEATGCPHVTLDVCDTCGWSNAVYS
jgi:hypothetical protein